MAEGDFPKVDGDILFASEVNGFHNRVNVLYTGTDFNTVAQNNTDVKSHELSTVDLSDSTAIDFLQINITALYRARTQTSSTTATNSIKIEVKDVGGSYSTVFDQIVLEAINPTGDDTVLKSSQTISYIHTLTANEKSNGAIVKITATSVSDGASTTAEITNKQVSLIAL